MDDKASVASIASTADVGDFGGQLPLVRGGSSSHLLLQTSMPLSSVPAHTSPAAAAHHVSAPSSAPPTSSPLAPSPLTPSTSAAAGGAVVGNVDGVGSPSCVRQLSHELSRAQLEGVGRTESLPLLLSPGMHTHAWIIPSMYVFWDGLRETVRTIPSLTNLFSTPARSD